YHCCGIDSYEDWEKISNFEKKDDSESVHSLPLSCCQDFSTLEMYASINETFIKERIQDLGLPQFKAGGVKCTKQYAYKVGCMEKIFSDVNFDGVHSMLIYSLLLIFHIILLRVMDLESSKLKGLDIERHRVLSAVIGN
ncbi:unnamed protein product, partial [Allacma fusca]